MRCNEKSNCTTARILATECNSAPAIASNLFDEVTTAAAIAPHGVEPCCFERGVFFAAAPRNGGFAAGPFGEDNFAADFAGAADCFALAPPFARELFECPRATGARWIG